jgi:CheY-like chemotaxis protein
MVEEDCLKVVDQPARVPTTKILIGEVSAINATVIKKFLEKLGYTLIIQVDNGVDAVAYATKEYFNIIFLDLLMPMLGGVEAARMIRKHERATRRVSTTIVGLTAVYTAEKEEMYNRDYGLDCLLRMPLHITDLKNVLEKFGIPKTVNSLRHLVMMYITNQPHMYHYTTQRPNIIQYKNQQYYLASDIMDELHQMKDSFPPLYKYPNFDGHDTAEILCIIATDYYPLKDGIIDAIDADDIVAVRRSATAMAAILKYVSPDAEAAALEMITCKDCAQALEFMQALTLYMENVWE